MEPGGGGAGKTGYQSGENVIESQRNGAWRGRDVLLVFLTMLPVTGVVPILKRFVMDGFGVSELHTHIFLAANMLAAFLAAPVVGALADRQGDGRRWLVGGALADALCFVLLPLAPSYAVLMALRFAEGIAHITVLSLLLATVARGAGRAGMARVGAAITFGVALGSPLGGVLGQVSTTLALWSGAGIMLLVALLARWAPVLPAAESRLPLTAILATLVRFPGLHLPYAFAFLDRFTVGFFVASFPIYTTLRFGFEPARIGLSIAAFMLTMGVLCYPTVLLGRFVSLRTLILGGSLVYGALFAAIGSVTESWLLVWMVLLGAASAVMFIPTLQLTARAAPAYAQATAMGGFNSAGALGFLLGPLVSGLLLAMWKDTLGTEAAYGMIFLAGGVLEFSVGAVLLVAGVWPLRAVKAEMIADSREGG